MTKQEIEKAIKNGESVWCVLLGRVEELKDLKFVGDLLKGYNKIDRFYHDITSEFFDGLYKTKAKAEHYLNHANVTRTETLPFLTWEEFKEKRELKFNSVDGKHCELFIFNDFIYLQVGKDITENSKQQNVGEATEENFYKAYDECIRLFRGEK